MTLLGHILSETKLHESDWKRNAEPHVKATIPTKGARGDFDIPISDKSIDVDAYFFNRPIRTGPNSQVNMTAILNYQINNISNKVYVGFFFKDMRRAAELAAQLRGPGEVMILLIAKPNGVEVENDNERVSIMNMLDWCIYHARQNGLDGIPVHKSFLNDFLSP